MKAASWAGLLLIPALMLTACGGRHAVRAEASSSSVQADRTAGKILLTAATAVMLLDALKERRAEERRNS